MGPVIPDRGDATLGIDHPTAKVQQVCDYCGCRLIPPIAELSEEHDRLLDLAYKLRRLADDGAREAAMALLEDEFTTLLRHHTSKEEQGIFDQLRSLGAAGARLDQLVDEHRDIEEQIARVQRGEQGWQDALRQLAADLSGHIVDEEVDLFPFAMYELDDAQWDTVAEVHAVTVRAARRGR